MVPDISVIRRTCLLCSTYRLSRPGDENRKLQVVSDLNELVYFYNNKYNELRSADASVAEINKARISKTLFLDALTECKACDKETDLINRKLMNFR